MNLYRFFFKRFIDITFSFFLLLLFFPVIVVLIILLYFANDGHPFFIQERPGINEKLFKLIKFRTMNNRKDANGKLLSDGERITKIGAFIRRTSLDEIPQLFNVLIGDMSLIGPRPLLVRYLPYFKETERARHSVRPGITGLAQVNGRNLLNWDDRLALDVVYVKNITPITDFIILIKTIRNVLIAKDIAVDANLTMQDLDEIRKKTI